MNGDPRAAYFDSIADKWDGWQDLSDEATARLAVGLDDFGLGKDETVIDVGCGTGNLTRVILGKLSPAGRVIAVDVSARMIDLARSKLPDPRVTWHVADARHLPLDASSVDRIICYSVWPHFDDHAAVMSELSRVLRPGGRLHVWHMISREMVNHIHAGAGPAVHGDMLAPANDTARLIESAGYDVNDIVDDGKRYLVSAVKRVR
jgi:ubiquinone/menaquinone biosynthesis C-methylase UbiE